MKKSLEIGTELSQLGKDADSLCGLRQREYDADVFRGLKWVRGSQRHKPISTERLFQLVALILLSWRRQRRQVGIWDRTAQEVDLSLLRDNQEPGRETPHV